jgi:hypothetical protein
MRREKSVFMQIYIEKRAYPEEKTDAADEYYHLC